MDLFYRVCSLSSTWFCSRRETEIEEEFLGPRADEIALDMDDLIIGTRASKNCEQAQGETPIFSRLIEGEDIEAHTTRLSALESKYSESHLIIHRSPVNGSALAKSMSRVTWSPKLTSYRDLDLLLEGDGAPERRRDGASTNGSSGSSKQGRRRRSKENARNAASEKMKWMARKQEGSRSSSFFDFFSAT